MKIDEVINAIHDKRQSLILLSADCRHEPKLAVYMSYEYWVECKKEIQAGVSWPAFEFFREDTIFGLPVWKVPATIVDGASKEHAPFLIVNIET